jgi:hypothetical protein
MRLVTLVLAITLSRLPAAPAAGQEAGAHVARGDSAYDALNPEEALAHYRAAIAADSGHYEALWKAARAIADIAKQLEGDAEPDRRRRDSLYAVGRDYADRAVAVDAHGADGHYALAMVLGRLSRTKGSKERVRFAQLIFDEASRALAIDSTHDGAHHVLGAWHAEIKRLSGLQRLFARTLFGAGFINQASWDWAVWHLQSAVAYHPEHVYHRLELALVLVDVKRYADARQQLEAIPPLPVRDVLDERYKREAAALLKQIKDKRDKA